VEICSPVFQFQTRTTLGEPAIMKTRSPLVHRIKVPEIERGCIVPPLVVSGWTPPVESVRTWIVAELKMECSYRQ
jgi:hypothetical protein